MDVLGLSNLHNPANLNFINCPEITSKKKHVNEFMILYEMNYQKCINHQ